MKTISKTKHTIRNSLTAIAAGAVLLVPSAAVFAHNGSGRGGHDQNNFKNQRQNSSRQVQARFAAQHGPRYMKSNQHGSWSEQDDRSTGSWWGDWRFNNNRNDDPDPNSCEARQARANKQTDRLKKASQYMLNRLSWQISDQQNYVNKHSLNPVNFADLKTTAQADKAAAQAAINALAVPSIDCDQPVVNDSVVLQLNKKPVLEALRVYNVDAVNISYAVQLAR